MNALKKEQRDLFNDPSENGRILPFNGSSFFTLNRIENKRLQQKTYKLDQLEFVLSHISQNRDTYMSQGFFSKPCRRALFIETITHAYIDIDCYKSNFFAENSTKQQKTLAILAFCDDNLIPAPSVIISSGRGIYLKWYWSRPIPRAAAGRAVAVNKQLVQLFSGMGSDPACVDVSRILRVVGTLNSKNNEPVELLHQTEINGKIITYDFEMFADEILPFSMAEIREFRAKQKERYEAKGQIILLAQERAKARFSAGNRKGFNKYDWCWKVTEDIRKLAEMRFNGLVPYCQESGRQVGPDMFAHIGASMLGHVIPSNQLWPEIKTWAGLILPASYVNDKRNLMAHSSSLLLKAKKGDSYKYRAQTIIERLEISSDEMLEMSCLIDKDEKRRRDREEWRKNHSGLSRDEYDSKRLAESEKLAEPWEKMGISRRTYYRRKNKGLI